MISAWAAIIGLLPDTPGTLFYNILYRTVANEGKDKVKKFLCAM
jgi:hypothetical protein